MIGKKDKNVTRAKRHGRVRNKVSGTAAAPRLNVYRSTSNIYAQIIDDTVGVTLVSASTIDKEVAKLIEGKTKTEAAKIVGQEVAKRALAKDITVVVYDRGGYLYTGRVSALAEGAREAGLQF